MKLPAPAAAVRRPAMSPTAPRAAVTPGTCKFPMFYFCHCNANDPPVCCLTYDYGGNGCSDPGTGCTCNPFG